MERREKAGAPEGRSTVVGDVAWTAVGSAVYLGAQWLTLVLVARALGEQALGEFALALAVTSPVVLLTRLQLRTVHATDAAREWAFADYLRVTMWGAVAAVALSAGVMAVAGVGASVFALGMVVVVGRAAESASEVVYGELQRSRRMRRVALAYAVKGGATAAGVGAGLALGGGLVGVGLGMLGAWTLTLVAVDLPARRGFDAGLADRTPAGRPAGRRGGLSLWPLLAGALPLGGVALISSLKVNVPKYVLAAESGEVAVGVFTALVYFIVLGGRANVSIGQAVAPTIARHVSGGRVREVRAWTVRYIGATLGIGVAAVAGAAAFGGEVLALVFGPEYAPYAPVFVVVMAAGLAEYLSATLRNLLVVLRSIRAQVGVTAVSLAVCFGAATVLVPSSGLMGAAVAFGLALFTEVVGYGAMLALAMRGLAAPRPVLAPAA